VSRKRNGYKLAPFLAMMRSTMRTPAWLATSLGARATLLALATNWNSNAQNSVFLSARDGEELLGVHKNTVCQYMHELEYYGFIVEVEGAHLGIAGVGKCAHYRLTDRHYRGKRGTYDFMNWDGVPYDPEKHFQARKSRIPGNAKKQNPVRKIRTQCPENADIRGLCEKAENGNKRPENPDIRNAKGCPENSDITSFNHCPADSRLGEAYLAVWARETSAVPPKELRRQFQRPAVRPSQFARASYFAAWYGQEDYSAAA
jgi:hypothetical protein